MSLQLTGTLHQVGQVEQITDKFQKRSFVLKLQDGQFEEHPQLELVQDKCSLIDNFKLGDSLTVSFNVRGREYTSKKDGSIGYFTSLQAWRIERAEGRGESGYSSPAAASSDTPNFYQSDADNDLPF